VGQFPTGAVKTPVESIHLPAKEDNTEGVALTHDGILAAKAVSPDSGHVLQERACLNAMCMG